MRLRFAGCSDVARYTVIATRNATSHKVTLFKDVLHQDGKTTSTVACQTLSTSAVQFLTCSGPTKATNSFIGQVVAVCSDGQVICMGGESLAIQWSSSAKAVLQENVSTGLADVVVEHVSAGGHGELTDGIFKNRMASLGATLGPQDAGAVYLAMVLRSGQQEQSRHLMIAAVDSGSSPARPTSPALRPLDMGPLPAAAPQAGATPTYQIDFPSALLFQLLNGLFTVYDISGSVPKVKSTVHMDTADSFTMLSKPFVLCSSPHDVGLYNHQYHSVHAKTSLDLGDVPSDRRNPSSCQLITYLRSQDLVVAVTDHMLVSMQVEPPKRHGKRRRGGLLIDSIGKGRATELPARKLRSETSSLEFSRRLPGTITEAYLATYHEDVAAADGFLSSGNVARWEALLLDKFRMSLKEPKPPGNGDGVGGPKPAEAEELPEWEWHGRTSRYPAVDRRWVLYATRRVFSLEADDGEPLRPRLRLILPESNVATYLAVAGHMTLSNVMSAFREEAEVEAAETVDLARDLVECLSEADETWTLLLNYIQATELGEVELLLAIRALMVSMDAISDANQAHVMQLLRRGPQDEARGPEADLDDLEEKVALMEYYLGDGSVSRSRGLTLAFTKLWRRPAASTVKALRAALRMEEVVSLTCLLRMELVRGAWTSLYLDATSVDVEWQDAPPDGSIGVIADLLGRCLDAVGAGGWLVNDATASSGTDQGEAGSFLTGLKLETSAALEGLQEAAYLNGILGEVVRFGFAAQKSRARRQTPGAAQATSSLQEGRASRMLPLGLKTKALPTTDKVVSGGEVVRRTAREMGHLISQVVEPYSLERVRV